MLFELLDRRRHLIRHPELHLHSEPGSVAQPLGPACDASDRAGTIHLDMPSRAGEHLEDDIGRKGQNAAIGDDFDAHGRLQSLAESYRRRCVRDQSAVGPSRPPAFVRMSQSPATSITIHPIITEVMNAFRAVPATSRIIGTKPPANPTARRIR